MDILEKKQVPAPVREKMDSFGFKYAHRIDAGSYEGDAYELFLSLPGKEPPFPTGVPVVVIHNEEECRTLSPEESYALLGSEE